MIHIVLKEGSGTEPGTVQPNLFNTGDNRGFNPSAAPARSRVSFMVDYDNGLAIVRQNPTHATNGNVGVHPADVGVEQDQSGRVRLRLEAVNGLIPKTVGDLGESVRGDLIVDPHGGPNGSASANGQVSQFPSWEVYASGSTGAGTPALSEHPATVTNSVRTMPSLAHHRANPGWAQPHSFSVIRSF